MPRGLFHLRQGAVGEMRDVVPMAIEPIARRILAKAAALEGRRDAGSSGVHSSGIA
jgi:hypothetical protein